MVSRTPLNRQQSNEQEVDDLGIPIMQEDEQNVQSNRDSDGDARTVSDPRVDALLKQIEDQQRKLQELSDTNIALLNQNLGVDTQTFVPEPLLEVPDIDVDVTGHVKATTENALRAERNERKKAEFLSRKDSDLNTKVEALWNDFNADHPEFADIPQDLVEIAATRVANRMKARNVNMERYMFGSRKRFFSDVADEFEKLFPGRVGEVEDEPYEEPAPRRRARPARQRREEDIDDGRASSVFGGSGSQRSGSRKSRNDADDMGSMIDDLQAEQLKNGFF